MNNTTYFLHQIKRTAGDYDKGIVVKETFELAKQGYHAYLGAYAYGQHETTDFVSVAISDSNGKILLAESWQAPTVEPEQEAAE